MAVGRITGQMLSGTLNRVTEDLTIRSTGAANLLQLDTSNNRVGVATASPTVPFEVTGAIKGSSTITANTLALASGSITDSTGAISFGNENLTTTGQVNTSGVRLLENEITTIRSNDDLVLSANGTGGVRIEGSLTVSSDLTVNGSVTTVNSTTLTVDDKNIELAHSPSGASASDTLADGGGVILKGSTDHTILWTNATDDWDFSDSIDVASGKVYKANGTEVLSATTVTTANAVHNVISSSDSTSVRINDGLIVDGALDVGSNFSISNGTSINAIVDEDDMSSNSATSLATQQSIKAYVDAQTSAAGVITIIDDSSSAMNVTIADDDIKIAGGANVTTSISGDTISVALDATLTSLTSVTSAAIVTNTISSSDSTSVVVNDGLQVDGALDVGSNFTISNGTSINAILDEDNLGSDSNTSLATQQSIKAYVDAQVTAQDLDFQGDGGGALSIDLDSETLDIAGGTNITTAGSGNTLTVNLDAALSGLTSVQIDSLNLQDNSITTDSNADLELTPGGTGIVKLDVIGSNNSSVINVRDGLDIDGAFSLNEGTTVNSILDQDDLSGDSDSALATQQSIKAYVDAQVTASDLDFQGDAGGALSIDLDSEVLDIAGGTNINTAGDTNTLTVNLDTALTGLTSVQVDSINIQDNSITTDSNADLEITPGGTGNVVMNKTDNQLILPTGTEAQRNGNTVGSIRYNTDQGSFEGYSASGWGGLGGGDLTAVDDSSTTISVTLAQNSVKFAGGTNLTSTVSGTQISYALDAALTGLTSVQIDSLNLQDNSITTDSNANLELRPAGTGHIVTDADTEIHLALDGAEKIGSDGTDLTITSGAKINLTATSDVHIPNNVGIAFGNGGEKIESDGTDLTATVTGNFIVSGTTAMVAPKGTTGQRPTVSTGLIRFNSTLGVYEGSTDGSTYSSFLTAPSGEAADINKDVFTTVNASTTAFTLSFTPAEAQNVLVFVDNIFQEPTENYTVSGTTLTMTAALHDGARLVALHGFDGSGGVSGATWIGGSNTDIDSAIENVDTFTTATYRSAEYTYVATNAEGDGDSTSGHETGKIMVVHDGTTAYMTQYGITHTGTAPVMTFSVDIDSSSVRLRAASIAANTGIRFARLGLAPL